MDAFDVVNPFPRAQRQPGPDPVGAIRVVRNVEDTREPSKDRTPVSQPYRTQHSKPVYRTPRLPRVAFLTSFDSGAVLDSGLVQRLVISLWLFGTLAVGQGIPALSLSGTSYFSLSDLALMLGYSTTEAGGSLTVRAAGGVLTAFDRSPEVLWRAADRSQEDELSLLAPVIVREGRWFAPADLAPVLGVAISADRVILPEGRELLLDYPPATTLAAADRFELVDLGNRARGLRFFADGLAGPDTVSLLIADLGLLALAFPGQQPELDAFMSELGAEKPLALVVTSVTESNWDPSVTFIQGERRLEARFPFRLRLLEGEAGRVGPEAPATAVVLLPVEFNLREPLTVTWSGASATVTFRE